MKVSDGYTGYTVGIRWVYGGYTVGIRGIRWVYGGYTMGIRWVYGGYTVITDISTVITGITYIQRLSPSHVNILWKQTQV